MQHTDAVSNAGAEGIAGNLEHAPDHIHVEGAAAIHEAGDAAAASCSLVAVVW